MLPFVEPPKSNFQQKLRALQRFVFISCAVCGAVLGGILIFVPVDESVHARGVVRAGEDTILYSPMDGTIGRILASEGEKVARGQALMEIDTTELSQKLRVTEAAISRARKALDAELAVFERSSRLPLPVQFWHVREELSIVREKTRQAAVEFQRAAEMQRDGLLSLQDVERARLALSINRSEEAKVGEKARIIESGMEGSALAELAARVEKARAELHELEVAREITMESIGRAVVRAPADGTLTLMARRRSGQAVETGDELLRLIHGEGLRAELFPGESQIHRVRPGLRVRMRTQAFNPLKYGYIEGTVIRVAGEGTRAPEGEWTTGESMQSAQSAEGGESTQGTREARFRVVASIDSSPQPLVIGSGVDASIVLRRVSLWRLLVPETISDAAGSEQPAVDGR